MASCRVLLLAALAVMPACASSLHPSSSSPPRRALAGVAELSIQPSAQPTRPDGGEDGCGGSEASLEVPQVVWRAHAGAAIAGRPTVDHRGRVYAGTSEGYIHAYDTDGAYRWSHTLLGAVSGAPAVDAEGFVYAGTTSGRVFALRPSGGAYWEYQLPSPIVGDVVLMPNRKLLVGQASGSVYVLSLRAYALWRTKLAAPLVSGPVRTAADGLAAGDASGMLVIVDAQRGEERLHFVDAVRPPLVPRADGGLLALSGDTLVAIDPQGKARWSFWPVRAFAASRESVAAVKHERELVWLSGAGEPLARYTPERTLGEAVTMDPAGRTFAVVGGALHGFARRCAAPSFQVPLDFEGDVTELHWDGPRERLLATSALGELAVVSVPARSRAPARTGE